METIKAYRCEVCEETSEETAGVPLYECGSCGTVFSRNNSADGDSHRCPDCNKFGSKLAGDCCSHCEEGQVAEVDTFECECGDLILPEDWDEHSADCASQTDVEPPLAEV